MTAATSRPGESRRYVERPWGSGSGGLADTIELILDKGLVIDAFVRVSLLGIELLTIDARIVVASVDTFLRFAEATNRLDLYSPEKRGMHLPELVESVTGSATRAAARGRTAGALDAAVEKVTGALDRGDEPAEAPRRRPRPSARTPRSRPREGER